MKSFITAIVCSVSLIGFSAIAVAANNSPLSSLGSIFKTHKHADASIIVKSEEITMGYAGADVATRITMPVKIIA